MFAFLHLCVTFNYKVKHTKLNTICIIPIKKNKISALFYIKNKKKENIIFSSLKIIFKKFIFVSLL